MGLRKLAEKVADYQQRLEAGEARTIEPRHVEKVLDKLRRKEADLLARIAAETDPDERADLDSKLRVAREHITRAEWLLAELS
jgi:predicted  nucleic acid-binding Zn-ribbon protein